MAREPVAVSVAVEAEDDCPLVYVVERRLDAPLGAVGAVPRAEYRDAGGPVAL